MTQPKGNYPLRDIHWSVCDNDRPTREQVLRHLQSGRHRNLYPARWKIDEWTLEELRALHDDIHEMEERIAETGPHLVWRAVRWCWWGGVSLAVSFPLKWAEQFHDWTTDNWLDVQNR